MPIWINFALIACLGLAILLSLVDYARYRAWPRLLSCTIALLIIAVALHFSIGFPSISSRQSFGTTSPMFAVGLMFVGVVLGIASTYVFNLTGSFSWRDFARPLVVSPLILLPLLGSLQGATLENLQLVCFSVLAFQNGFFWQQVLRDSKPTT